LNPLSLRIFSTQKKIMRDKNKNIVFDNISPKKIFNGNKKSILFFDHINIVESNKTHIALQKGKNKLFIIFFFLLTTFLFITFLLFKLSITSDEINIFKNNPSVSRGKIIDRNETIISASIPTLDLYLDGKKIINEKKTIENLKSIFFKKKEGFFKEIVEKKQYKLVSKHLSEFEENEVRKLGEPGLIFHDSHRRIYPQDNLFSNVTGFISKFGEAQSKLEKFYDDKLKNGIDIKLTLDLKIQNIIHEELTNSENIFSSKGSLGLLINVNNGKIISMVSKPDYNPNHPITIKPFSENNLITDARFEMGSILKIYNAAMAFENNSIERDKLYDVSKDYALTKTYKVKDSTKFLEPINFEKIFTHSSNIGSIKIYDSLGKEKQKNFLKNIGLSEHTKIEGLSTIDNKLPNNKQWNEVISKSISYGYGLSITPLSLVTTFSSLVNGGLKIRPKIVDSDTNNKERIISKQTSIKISDLLKKVVENGTGKNAKVRNLGIGGKTGTAKKSNKMGGYHENKVITSFLGVFPINKPKYLLLILFDEPQTGFDSLTPYGSNTAAPVFSKIVNKIAPILNLEKVENDNRTYLLTNQTHQ